MKHLIFFSILFSCVSVYAQPVRIAVITDFEKTSDFELLINQTVREIDQTTGSTRSVILESSTYGIANQASASEIYHQMENNIDLVLSVGSISSKALSAEENLSIPVIALGVIDPDLQDFPFINGTSGKENFTYVWLTRDLQNELSAFKNLYEFKNLVIFIGEKAVSTANEQKVSEVINSLSSEFKTRFSFIPVGSDINSAINQIPEDADAAYFTVMLGQTEENIQRLINELNERQMPTFSGNARLIDLGVLGSLTNENNIQQGIRKLAIMID